jgi:hypothetical protein
VRVTKFNIKENVMKIDKNIPIPEVQRKGKSSSYNFKILEVDDSFLVPNPENLNLKILKNRVNSALTYYERISDTKFTTRQVVEEGVEGIRVWRIK